jgi:HK97 family phage major capsid protein
MAWSEILKMKEKRAGLVTEARGILDKAEAESRDRTTDEETRWDAIMTEVNKLNKDITVAETQLEAERKSGNRQDEQRDNRERRTDDEHRDNPRATEEYRAAYSRFLSNGASALNADEHRAMQADSSIGGGYLVAPVQMVTELLKTVDDMVIIGSLARPFPLARAASLGVPTLTKKADDADWTSELKSGNLTELEFGQRELRPHPLAKRALISNTLLRVAVMDVEQLVNSELARVFSETFEKAYMTGDGAQKPLGVFTPSDNGIPTSRDISAGNTATAIKFDGLKNAKYSIKQQYQAKLKWIFHRDAVSQMAKEKDGNGQYIWQQSVVVGEPDRLLQIPILMSEFAPNDLTSGKYAGILGDFSYYWIARALDMAIQRIVELYSLTNQTGFHARAEADGMPVMAEAFTRVKLG